MKNKIIEIIGICVEPELAELRAQEIMNLYDNSLPYICPVCRGTGAVMNGYYNQTPGEWSTSDLSTEKCLSCEGTGIVWNNLLK